MVKEETNLNKKLKYGAISSVSIIIIAVVLTCVNMFANKFDIKYDLTKEKLYTISEQTKKIINGLNQKINIYVLSAEDKNNLIMNKLIDQYKSKNIKVEYKDPEKFPQFTSKYESQEKISPNSIIIETEKKFKVIDANDLVSYDYDYVTYQTKIKSIDVEPQITNAIRYITSSHTPVIYKLIGHNEQDLDESYKKQIELANYQIKDLDLITEQKIPDDCKILFITTPQRDWTSEESLAIDNFFSTGNALIFMDYTNEHFPNMINTIKKYGFEFANSIIVESNSKNFAGNNNTYLIPNYTDNEICYTLAEKKYKLLVPICRSILINDNEKVRTLLESSKNSYGKVNLNSSTISKESKDLPGPLNIAVYCENEKSKIIAVGSTSILDKNINSYIGGSNCDFVINSINNLTGEQENLYIPPKTHETNRINFTHKEIMIISAISIIILPSLVFFIGAVIIKKRNAK